MYLSNDYKLQVYETKEKRTHSQIPDLLNSSLDFINDFTSFWVSRLLFIWSCCGFAQMLPPNILNYLLIMTVIQKLWPLSVCAISKSVLLLF